jgi:iron complex transport system permease protein
MPARRTALALIALAALAAASLIVALSAGSIPVSPATILRALFAGDAGGSDVAVVQTLRLPRALAAFACGALLAVAGALMQVLLRNPLADPYVLGVSGGASVGAMLAILAGLPALGLNASAFAGAIAALALVFGLARGEGAWSQARLLLTGIVIASGCGAVVALLLTIAPDRQLHAMLFWLMGDLSAVTLAWPAWLSLSLVLVLVLPAARDLNLLARGEATARALGVAVARVRWLTYVAGALATAAAVTTAGAIGFVGLIVPHLVRLVIGNDQRLLLPAAALAGGTLLTVADTAARALFAPLQLPVGVLTALIGVPLFLYLLSRHPK